MKKIKFIYILLFSSIFFIGCKTYDNFTTYFNTYYNADRLIDESENEFEFQDEKKRVFPKVFISQPNYWIQPDTKKSPVVFMDEFVIDKRQLQPVKIKLDSVIIKGSKILAKHPNSNYVENTLYLMAKSYFYQSDWINCQVKCSELIDKFPYGDLIPDAHLMIAKTYLIRKKTITGLTILSRCVDVAWLKKRYDILSEAFRLEAEVALRDGRFDDALKPYLQAVAQSDDEEQRAKWQVDLAALLYRIGRYDKALIAFEQVRNFSPDYSGLFESKFYSALSQIRLGNYEIGMETLSELENDGKFEDWKDYVTAGRLLNYKLSNDDKKFQETEKFADSAFSNSYMIQAIYFEIAMMHYDKKEYVDAQKYLAQVRNARSDFYTTANKLYQNLVAYSQKKNEASKGLQKYSANQDLNDSLRLVVSNDAYEFARINEILGNQDSAIVYYKYAMDIAPIDSNTRARYVYTYQRVIRDTNPLLADSLFEQIADLYPKTEFGKEAYKKLGYTEFFAIDTIPELYKSANQMRRNGLYQQSINAYKEIYDKYHSSPYSPKSLYSIGLVYEENLKILDSAIFYYTLLKIEYPDNELVKDINTSLVYQDIIKKGEQIPDSLLPMKVYKTPKRDYLSEIESGNAIERANHFDKQQHFNTKKKSTLEQYWDNLKDQYNPMDKIDSLKSKIKDTKVKDLLPGVKINTPIDKFRSKSDSDSTKIPTLAPVEALPISPNKENENKK